MLKIECNGLTLAETRELEQFLAAQEGVEHVRFEMKMDGVQRRSAGIQNAIPDIWLIVALVGSSLAAPAAKSAAGEMGKDIYAVVKKWMATKFAGKSIVEVGVTLYGPDGRPIQKIKAKR